MSSLAHCRLFYIYTVSDANEVFSMAYSTTSLITPMDELVFHDFFFMKTNFPDIPINLASTNYLLWKAQAMKCLIHPPQFLETMVFSHCKYFNNQVVTS